MLQHSVHSLCDSLALSCVFLCIGAEYPDSTGELASGYDLGSNFRLVADIGRNNFNVSAGDVCSLCSTRERLIASTNKGLLRRTIGTSTNFIPIYLLCFCGLLGWPQATL